MILSKMKSFIWPIFNIINLIQTAGFILGMVTFGILMTSSCDVTEIEMTDPVRVLKFSQPFVSAGNQSTSEESRKVFNPREQILVKTCHCITSSA